MVLYLVHFTQTHESFRLPELTSIAEIHGFRETMKITPPDEMPRNDRKGRKKTADEDRSSSFPASPDAPRPFITVELESEDQAKILAARCVLIKAIYELWAHAPTYELLHELNRQPAVEALWKPYRSTPFKMHVTAIHHTFPAGRVNEVIRGFSYMDFERVAMDDPGVVLWICEEYELRIGMRPKTEGDGEFIQVYFGRLVADGTARSLIAHFDVKKRAYFGTTSMEAEMSLIMANQARAAPGKLIYDPFVGTGSLLYTCAYFGAMVFGSDIDGRQMRGKDPTSLGVMRAASQYNVAQRILDCATFDITYNPWRTGGLFDAIITDPPYGVRAGAKRIGSSILGRPLNPEPRVLPNGVAAHTKPTYIPPTRPYEISDLANDLVELARWLLKPGGRLVFFLPTVTDDYSEVDLPLCEGMSLVANSLQDFGKWGRRLITLEKVVGNDASVEPPSFVDHMWNRREQQALAEDNGKDTASPGGHRVPAHRRFRDKYFMGFKREESNSLDAATNAS
ncbi:hypothetical protein FRB99_004002 [Tulasnella sp. 403]|nr:hypothetical protein FRB99_004002 [Tulasnella sp. 403]